jgi:hypothetical protein
MFATEPIGGVERKVTWWCNKWRLLTFCMNSLLFFYLEQINLHDIDFLLQDYRIRLTGGAFNLTDLNMIDLAGCS